MRLFRDPSGLFARALIELLGCASIGLLGCASTPRPEAMVRGFRALDGDEKNAFLTIYPWLDAAERQNAVTDPTGYTRAWLEADPVKRAELLRQTAADRITELSVRAEPALQATLNYRRAPPADVTEDSLWSITPEDRATIVDGHVVSRCASEGADLSANFLGHISKSVRLEPGAEPKEIILKRRDALRGAEPDTIYFELLARCTNETADVSCAATWSTESSELEVSSCGRVARRAPPRSKSERTKHHQVSAIFRGKTSRLRFVFEESDSPLH